MPHLKFWSAPGLKLAVLGIGITLAACQTYSTNRSSAEVPATLEESLRIGVLLPLTGEDAAIGKPILDGLPALVDRVNACGGINHAPVSLVVEDTQSDLAAGLDAMLKLAEADRVHAVVGALDNQMASAAVGIAVDHKISLVSSSSTSPSLTQRAKAGEFQGYWARTVPSEVYQARALAKLAIANELKSVATIVTDTEDGIEFEQAFTTAFESLGGTIATKDRPIRYDFSTSAVAEDAAAAFERQPDAVLTALDADTGSILLQSAYDQGLTDGVQIMVAGDLLNDRFINDIGRKSDGQFVLAGALTAVPGISGKDERNLSSIGQPQPNNLAAVYLPYTWDAAALVMLAAEAAGQNSGEGIKATVPAVAADGTEVTDICQGLNLLRQGEQIDYQGITGSIDLDQAGDVTGHTYDVWTVNELGRLERLDQVTLD